MTDWDAKTLLAALIQNSEDAILSLTPTGSVVSVNRAAEAMFGYRSDELIGQSVFQLVPLGFGGDLQEQLKRIRNGETVEHYETVRMRKDGSRFHVSLRISAIKDTDGKLLGVSWIVRDISAQKEAEALARRLSTIVEQTADSVIITNREGIIEYVNPAFVSTTGYSKEEAMGKTCQILKSGKHTPLFYKNLWTTILSGLPFQATMINRKKNGQFFFTEKTITPIRDAEGHISNFVSTDKNISDRNRTESRAMSLVRGSYIRSH